MLLALGDKADTVLLHSHQHQNCETLVNCTSVVGIFGWRVIDICEGSVIS